MIKKISILLLFICFNKGNAQQFPSYSQYMDNAFIYNPAVAGNSGVTIFNAMGREQWLGIPNSPRTHTFSFQTRITKRSYSLKSALKFLSTGKMSQRKVYRSASKGRVGLGGSVFDDRSGLIGRTGAQFCYAYHMYIGTSQLSMGLSLSAYQLRLNRSGVNDSQLDDPMLLSDGIRSAFSPDASVGAYWMHRNYFAGISTSQIMQSYVKFGSGSYDQYRLLRHYYFMSGYYFILPNSFQLLPALMIKTTERLNFQIDFSAKLIYDEVYALGLSYRNNKDIVMMCSVRMGQIYFGYAFDLPTTPIRQNSLGTHEFSLSFIIGSDERRYRWKDRF